MPINYHKQSNFSKTDPINTFKATIFDFKPLILMVLPLLEVQLLLENVNLQPTDINNIQEKRPKTSDLNSEILATYFQELNYNIIKYCEEKYPVQSKYSFDFESETKTSNKGKQKVKQYSKTTPNTPTLPKTTAKHLQTPEQETSSPRNLTQQQEPISISTNIIEYLQKNESKHSENLGSEETESEQKEATESKEEIATAYIAKISEFTGIAEEWFENLEESFEDWQAFKDVFLQQFTDNNTSITLWNCFHNIKQETSETVMTYLGRFNKLLRRIQQLETNNYYSDAQILDQFIAGLKDKLIKKVRPHAPENLATAIRHAKNYKMIIEKANHTKLVNLAIGKTSSAAEKKID
ncbi:hypothetical protein G9A89_015428 [Geosiphon pyriformis]|nr:hypothetical protein G9A89_015428 [Geosiphon pyriformis]